MAENAGNERERLLSLLGTLEATASALTSTLSGRPTANAGITEHSWPVLLDRYFPSSAVFLGSQQSPSRRDSRSEGGRDEEQLSREFSRPSVSSRITSLALLYCARAGLYYRGERGGHGPSNIFDLNRREYLHHWSSFR